MLIFKGLVLQPAGSDPLLKIANVVNIGLYILAEKLLQFVYYVFEHDLRSVITVSDMWDFLDKKYFCISENIKEIDLCDLKMYNVYYVNRKQFSTHPYAIKDN